MSPKNASHNQHCLLDSTSTRTRFDYSSTSLPSHSRSSQADLLDPLDDITVDSDLDQRSASSSTLLSRRVSSSLFTNQLLTDANYASSESDLSTQLSESRQSRFLYSLRKPGQMTAQRTQRLRVRTAVVIMSIPATSEDVIDMDDHEPSNALKVPPVAPPSKLRRVSGVRDLRSAFCDGDHTLPSVSPMGPPKASYELGILITPTLSLSPLSPRSSLRTLVDAGNTLPKKWGDVKTLYESTLGSISISSRFVTKLHSTLSPSQTSQTFLPTDTSQSMLPTKYHIHNLSIARSRRHTSLQLDTRLSRSPREVVWSCAKISQSATKRAARCGHTPKRIFSNPIVALPS